MPIEKLNLPKGRIVGGHPIKAEDKLDFHTKKPILTDQGAKIPQWRVEYAIPKDVFLAQVWPLMVQEAATAFPINPQTGLPNVSRDFSWKMVDGDSPECPKGSKVPYNVREGYPGHYVLTLKTEAFAPGTAVFQNGAYHMLQESQVKCGDYITANVNIKVHADKDGGLYLNPNGFELVEIGQAIATGGGGGNPETLFGTAATRTTPGFTGVLPTAGAPAPMLAAPQVAPAQAMGYPTAPMGNVYVNAGMPAQSAPVAMPGYGQPALSNGPAAPMNAYPSNAPGAAMPPPAHDFVQNLGLPQTAPVGNVYPAANVMPMQPGMPQAVYPTAAPVNSSPYNSTPGFPPQR